MSTAANQEIQSQESKPSDKEYNFRALEAERNRLAKIAEEERTARIAAEQALQERSKNIRDDDDDSDNDDEPYIDKKALKKHLSKLAQDFEQKIDKKSEEKARRMLDEERKNQWLKNNPDFYEVMQHAQKFAEKDPELAETILEMPEGFERQKLVYKNIKALGIHKKEEPKPSIQETIDRNRKSPYYQPSGVGTPPYAASGDFSPTGQKSAYAKMQELKDRLRIG